MLFHKRDPCLVFQVLPSGVTVALNFGVGFLLL